jgi:hypothetical protein
MIILKYNFRPGGVMASFSVSLHSEQNIVGPNPRQGVICEDNAYTYREWGILITNYFKSNLQLQRVFLCTVGAQISHSWMTCKGC